MSNAMNFFRSLLFSLIMLVITPIWACVCFLAAPLPYNKRYFITSRWNVFIIWLAKVLCGIRYQIKGFENLPNRGVQTPAESAGDSAIQTPIGMGNHFPVVQNAAPAGIRL